MCFASKTSSDFVLCTHKLYYLKTTFRLALATWVHMLVYVSEHGSGVNATSAAFSALPETDSDS
ncbi:hypothetical protein ACTXT7_008428 [Hymenolepis weldensis]